jgi:hypothetical protein
MNGSAELDVGMEMLESERSLLYVLTMMMDCIYVGWLLHAASPKLSE